MSAFFTHSLMFSIRPPISAGITDKKPLQIILGSALHAESQSVGLTVAALRRAQGKPNPNDFPVGSPDSRSSKRNFFRTCSRSWATIRTSLTCSMNGDLSDLQEPPFSVVNRKKMPFGRAFCFQLSHLRGGFFSSFPSGLPARVFVSTISRWNLPSTHARTRSTCRSMASRSPMPCVWIGTA